MEWNRGAYLVNGPAHCAECHSPRNVLGAIVQSQRFAGGPDPEGGDGWVPNITQAGIGDYSERDIERILETGDMPNGDSVGGAMTAVVSNTSKLPAEDRAAISLYVKSLPPVEGPKHPVRAGLGEQGTLALGQSFRGPRARRLTITILCRGCPSSP